MIRKDLYLNELFYKMESLQMEYDRILQLPEFVIMGDKILQYDCVNDYYYNHKEDLRVDYDFDSLNDEKIIVYSVFKKFQEFEGTELIETTYENWYKQNKEYLNE